MTSQNFSHIFTSVIPDINQLNESMGGGGGFEKVAGKGRG